jgi:hypothetical protein
MLNIYKPQFYAALTQKIFDWIEPRCYNNSPHASLQILLFFSLPSLTYLSFLLSRVKFFKQKTVCTSCSRQNGLIEPTYTWLQGKRSTDKRSTDKRLKVKRSNDKRSTGTKDRNNQKIERSKSGAARAAPLAGHQNGRQNRRQNGKGLTRVVLTLGDERKEFITPG